MRMTKNPEKSTKEDRQTKATPELPENNQMSRLKIVVGIPAYNEEQYISEVVRKARRFTDEVIVVDDGSTDNTSQVAEVAGAVVIRHSVNKGYGETLKTCFEVTKANIPDILVILDGDGQHDPDDIPRLLAPILSGEADVIIGSRFLGKVNNIPQYRKLGIGIITFLYNFASKVKVSDAQSGFRAYGKEVMNAFTVTEIGMGASVEAIVKIREKGFNITEVPISCIYHSGSHSTNPVTHGLSVALTVVKLRLRNLLRRSIEGNGA